MAHAITFDKLAFVKTLEKAQIEPEKAEAIAEAVASVFENDLKDVLFTKHDAELLEARLLQAIGKSKLETISWMISIILAQTGLLALIMLLIKFFS